MVEVKDPAKILDTGQALYYLRITVSVDESARFLNHTVQGYKSA